MHKNQLEILEKFIVEIKKPNPQQMVNIKKWTEEGGLYC